MRRARYGIAPLASLSLVLRAVIQRCALEDYAQSQEYMLLPPCYWISEHVHIYAVLSAASYVLVFQHVYKLHVFVGSSNECISSYNCCTLFAMQVSHIS